jgi:hypothetical protein
MQKPKLMLLLEYRAAPYWMKHFTSATARIHRKIQRNYNSELLVRCRENLSLKENPNYCPCYNMGEKNTFARI